MLLRQELQLPSQMLAQRAPAATAAPANQRLAVPGASDLVVDANGMVHDRRIELARSTNLEKGPMPLVHGVIVHQTGAPTAASTLNSYQVAGANGAHFLIDLDGKISQTASLLKQTYHVGKLRARCIAEKRCPPAELAVTSPSAVNRLEMGKAVPDRYPSNRDSIGIELVGAAIEDPNSKGTFIYNPVTAEQNASLRWLVNSLSQTLNVPMTEVFRHPEVSRKQPTEASTARWR